MTVKIEPESIVQNVVARVRPYLERIPIHSLVPEIVEEALHLEELEEGWWYIPVGLNSQEPRTFEYYDRLTDIEDESAGHTACAFCTLGSGRFLVHHVKSNWPRQSLAPALSAAE